MTKNPKRTLNWFSLAISLVSLHFGLGFLIGSGEAIYANGVTGILYALSAAAGLIALAFISSFYWKHKYPIWTLMGKKYGKGVESLVAFLSLIWMIGVVAAQILGGAAALTIFGVNKYISMVVISVLILFLTLVRIEKLSRVLLYMLIFTSLSLLLVQFSHGLSWVPISFQEFLRNQNQIKISDWFGIFLPTVLVTFIGMDFHQFLVRSKSRKDAIYGNIVGAIILAAISFLLLGLVYSSIRKGLLLDLTDAKEVIPMILYRSGFSIHPVIGSLLPLMVVFVAVGSGSGVARIVSETIMTFNLIPKSISKDKITSSVIFTTALSFIIAITGKSIISLIVAFYAIYVGSVIVQFVVYLFEEKIKKPLFTPNNIRLSIILATLSCLIIFSLKFLPSIGPLENEAAFILGAGVSASFVTLLVSKLLNRTLKILH